MTPASSPSYIRMGACDWQDRLNTPMTCGPPLRAIFVGLVLSFPAQPPCLRCVVRHLCDSARFVAAIFGTSSPRFRNAERAPASFGSGCRQIMPSLWGRVAALFCPHHRCCPHLVSAGSAHLSFSRTARPEGVSAPTRYGSRFRSPLRSRTYWQGLTALVQVSARLSSQ